MRNLESKDSNIPYEYLAERAIALSGAPGRGPDSSCVQLVETQNIRVNNMKWQRSGDKIQSGLK